MLRIYLSILIFLIMTLFSCKNGIQSNATGEEKKDTFNYVVDQFADIQVLRYRVPDFESLTLQQKKLAYYLSQAALCGRDILYDQFYKYNLLIRQTLEGIYKGYNGEREAEEFKEFVVYLKRVWFSNGIHHHYSTDKIMPGFTKAYFKMLMENTKAHELPLDGKDVHSLYEKLAPVIFDPEVASKRVNSDPQKGLIKGSACNFYTDNLTQQEVEAFYEARKDPDDKNPVEYGHNSKLVKENDSIYEKVWKKGGMYSDAIEEIIGWLEKAAEVAENETQKAVIELLISFYQTGDLKQWDAYNMKWVTDTISGVDFINGFIEVYNDPLGMRGTWEALVNFRDEKATGRMKKLANNAQWFENHSPVNDAFKKENVSGVTGKVINVVQLGGDVYPYSPIGINLPNSDWIRSRHGSKSVTLNNIMQAHYMSSLESGMLEEFAYSDEEIALSKAHGLLAHTLHVDMHELLGHGSGQMMEGVSADDLKNYHSTIEEARADLFALYYAMDEKLVSLGLMPSLDVGRAEYNSYIRGGLLVQLTRIKPGNDLEEAHMRNRQIIAKWAYEKGKSGNVIEQKKKNGKTYFVVNDHEKLRSLFGELLEEVQRIKSEGDFDAAKALVEGYGVKVDTSLHNEALKRYKKLNLTPYTGFINPVLVPQEEAGTITDVKLHHPDNYVDQMLKYAEAYSFLTKSN